MTDQPCGQGGSPHQNLIQRDHSRTVLTALRCTSEEIFLRADALIDAMITRIVRENLEAQPPQADSVLQSLRKDRQSNMAGFPPGDLLTCYDQIRMLDAECYFHAYLEEQGLRLGFRRVSQRSEGLHAPGRRYGLKPIRCWTDRLAKFSRCTTVAPAGRVCQ